MNILILHRIPYHKIDYQRGIDHAVNNVVYLGTAEALQTIPSELPCTKIARPGIFSAFIEACEILSPKEYSFDRIISLSEYELLDAAQLRHYFKINGPTVDDVLKVRDKLLMKSCVQDCGIKVPIHASLESFISEKNNSLDCKVVLKPVDGASSENVLVFESTRDLMQALKAGKTGIEAIDNNEYSGYEVEAFVDGPILHFDGLVDSGEIKVLVGSQYIGTCLAYAQGQPLGSFQIELTQKMQTWVSIVLKAVNLRRGSFHLEAIVSNDELVFLEVANRVGGADVVNAVELATGVHLPSEELKIYLGNTSFFNPEIGHKKYGWFVFPGHHLQSQYCSVSYTEEFKNKSEIVRWNELATDAPLLKRITYQAHEVPVAGLVQSDDSHSLQMFIQALFDQIEVNVMLLEKRNRA